MGIGELDRRAENIEDSEGEASCRRGRAAADSAASQISIHSILFKSIPPFLVWPRCSCVVFVGRNILQIIFGKSRHTGVWE